MNTIIYLYHSREITEYLTEKWREEDYCLIRLGIPELLWKNLKNLEKLQDSDRCQKEATYERLCQKETSLWKRLIAFCKGLCGKKEEEQVACQEDEETKKRQELCRRIEELLDELGAWKTALSLLGDNPHWTYCVYEGFLRDKIYTERFEEIWDVPEFEDYREHIWVRKLMPHTIPGDYMILGCADCLPDILCGNAGKMRSVKWILQTAQYTSEMEAFIDNFYEEYGLAVELRLTDEEWVRVRPASRNPVNILDFTGEEKISACDVATGSIWLDMDSMDGKNRRMEARNPEIIYISMKKLWKQRQKEGICLDTVNKNGYNTIVK